MTVKTETMHNHISSVDSMAVAPDVTKRVLLRFEDSASGGLEVTHHTLQAGQIVFEGTGLEHQHYIVSGCALMRHRFIHSDTAVFVPGSVRFGEMPQHTIAHAGETELRIVTAAYRTPHPNFRWAKTRIKNFYQSGPVSLGQINNQQLFTEEEHALMGALRMHAIDVQTHAPLMNYVEHRNPEEIIYVLRGTGEILSNGTRHKVSPGSLVYTKEGDVHGIFNTNPVLPLQYFVLEFIEHEKMWPER
jgi:mannose-6-phosphate isomerase-like protein (cupin superfamily)